MEKDRKQKFVELVASGKKPYPAAIEAGYSRNYAKAYCDKLLDKCRKDIEALKPIAQKAIEEEFKYTIKESFSKLNEIQNLALLQDEKGNFQNLGAAIKAEELKGKMYGVYEADNSQKKPDTLSIVVRSDKG